MQGGDRWRGQRRERTATDGLLKHEQVVQGWKGQGAGHTEPGRERGDCRQGQQPRAFESGARRSIHSSRVLCGRLAPHGAPAPAAPGPAAPLQAAWGSAGGNGAPLRHPASRHAASRGGGRSGGRPQGVSPAGAYLLVHHRVYSSGTAFCSVKIRPTFTAGASQYTEPAASEVGFGCRRGAGAPHVDRASGAHHSSAWHADQHRPVASMCRVTLAAQHGVLG